MKRDSGGPAKPGGEPPAPPSEGARGLTRQEAEERLRRDGPNILPAPAGPPAWRQLLGQMVHFFALLLWVAGGLAFLAGMPALGVAIFVVIVINGVVAFIQEYRAERAARRLRELLPRRAKVIRDGQEVEIEARDLVRGDVVLLGPGDRVSADIRLVDAQALQVNTAALTGESAPTAAEAGAEVYAGSFITEGEGRATVIATGDRTRLAGIARLTRAGERPRSPLARELHRVVRIIAAIALGIGIAFFGVALLVGIPPSDGFIFAIGVTVALVPEALLPTVTLSLAMGAQRMAKKDALVRRLESVETLGATTFICTDKTGTLTTGEMAVVEVWTPAGRARIHGAGYEPKGKIEYDGSGAEPAVRNVARVAARASTGRAIQQEGRWVAQGDPMDAALDTLARRIGLDMDHDRGAEPDRRRFPFDPRRRRMSVVAGDRVLVKGAPDAILPLCRSKAGADAALEDLTGRGLRVIAVASRTLASGEEPRSAGDAERDLELLGLVGLEDPPRPGAADSIAACRRAGIKVAMITGDHPATARSIAREVGLLGPAALVVLGNELPEDDEALGALLDHDGIVVSRVDPETKLRIAKALRHRGHVVAMTGDGVNDGPALQAADIGVAMGRTGTDVAREAADLVLLNDDFSTIVAAIEQGRATYANVRRFLTYHLTDNVAEVTPFIVWALSGGRIPLALGVLQVLALDVGTDTFSAVALGAEAPVKGTLDAPPPRGHILDRGVARRVFAVLGPVEAVMAMLAFFATFLAAGWRPGEAFPKGAVLLAASGAAFAAVVLGQAANAFACRSEIEWSGALGWLGNRLLVIAVSVDLLIAASLVFVPPLARVLGQAPPTAAGWIVALLAAPAVLAVDALDKAVRRRRTHPAAPRSGGPPPWDARRGGGAQRTS